MKSQISPTGQSSVQSSVSSGQIVQNARFADTSVALKTLATRCNLPTVVKLTSASPGVSVQTAVKADEAGRPVERTPIYVHSVHVIRNVVAESIKIRENLLKKTTIVGSSHRYAIPTSYEGLFEVLSADGRAAKPMTTIEDLYRCAPSKFLLRESLKGHYAKESGQITLSDKQKTIAAFEVLRIEGVNTVGGSGSSKRMLRCRDSQGQTIFLPFEQRCLVSPVAGQTNISGVHDLRQMLDKFRLPIHVRLVSGRRPTDKHFTGCFRLTSSYTSETAFALPLKKDADVLPVSCRSENVRLHLAVNFTPSRLRSLPECKHYDERCAETIDRYMNTIHTLIHAPKSTSTESKHKLHRQAAVRRPSAAVPVSGSKVRSAVSSVDRRVSCDVTRMRRSSKSPEATSDNEENDYLFDELDDIYRYVREGGVVPTARDIARAASPASTTTGSSTCGSSASGTDCTSSSEDEDAYAEEHYSAIYTEESISQRSQCVKNRSASFNIHAERPVNRFFENTNNSINNSGSPPQTLTDFFGSDAPLVTLPGTAVVHSTSNVAAKERTVRFMDSELGSGKFPTDRRGSVHSYFKVNASLQHQPSILQHSVAM